MAEVEKARSEVGSGVTRLRDLDTIKGDSNKDPVIILKAKKPNLMDFLHIGPLGSKEFPDIWPKD